jgi:hypothetical protein
MKRASVLIVLAVLWSTYASAGCNETDSMVTRLPNTVEHRGFLKTVGTVSAQFFVGTMGGLAGLILTKVHPVVGGIGWIVGSSFGVYSVGDAGTGRGDFWWTAAAGTGMVLVFTPYMASNDPGAAIAGAAAILTSLIAEIVAYHITEGPTVPQVSMSVGYLNSSLPTGSGHSGSVAYSRSLAPCLLISISF